MITKAWKRMTDRAPAISRSLTRAWGRARSALLTTAGLGTGVGACWTAWGVAAGLGSLAVAFLLLEWLTRDDPEPDRAKGAR